MIEYVRISIQRDDAGEDLFRKLLLLYPKNELQRNFFYHAPRFDATTSEILKLLESSNRIPWDWPSHPPINCKQNFTLQLERHYDIVDRDSSSLLELRPLDNAHFFDSPRRDDGLLRLLQGYLDDSIDFGFTMPTWYVVPDRVKRILQESPLIGPIFRPTHLLPGLFVTADTPIIPWSDYGNPWWEIDSTITLPQLSDSMNFTDMSGKPVKQRDFANGFHRQDGLYLHLELHYRASDIACLPPFDLARTYEPFGNRKGYDRTDCPLVASRGFYDFCLSKGLATNWIPVRIDSGN